MFTDIVGFTALTQHNEEHALALLEVHHRLLRPIFPRFHGREIKTIGDSFLVEFESALDATACSIDIQTTLHGHNLAAAEPDRFRVRIGIHLGDVVHTENDVLGDAINLASRIEPLAEPGGICVSEQVFAQVRNKIANPLTKLPPHELKNVTIPMEVYKIGLSWDPTSRDAGDGAAGVARRIAVLPLANMSPDPQDEFFADGLTEEIISELSRVPGLRVIARTSVMRFRGASKGVAEIGKELHVGTILEGSVRRAGSRIRVTAQLVDVATEEHLWSERYDRELVDVFAIQSEIAKEVATALNIALPPAALQRRRPPPIPAAFHAYLRGRHLWNRRSEEQVRGALRSFEEALRLDPEYAAAYSGIADCYSILVDQSWEIPRVGASKARAAAEHAVQLDDTMAEAHASLGLALAREYRWPESEREYRRALELNPMYASAHQWYYMELVCQGRPDEAIQELARAEEADPLSSIIQFHQAVREWHNGDDEAALAAWKRSEELGGNVDFMRFYKAAFLASRSMRPEALEILRQLKAAGRTPVVGEVVGAMVYGFLGMRDEATRDLEAIGRDAAERPVPAYQLAWVYAALGDADRFFESLFQCAEEKARQPFEFIVSPPFEELRKDPRFHQYLRRCGLGPV
jgi:adenylate cyclase